MGTFLEWVFEMSYLKNHEAKFFLVRNFNFILFWLDDYKGVAWQLNYWVECLACQQVCMKIMQNKVSYQEKFGFWILKKWQYYILRSQG